MGRIQVFSELLQPTSRPGANLSAQNNVTRNIPPCFSGKMQIGSSPLVRRSLDKALLEPRSLFGVFPAWNVMVGGSKGRTWGMGMSVGRPGSDAAASALLSAPLIHEICQVPALQRSLCPSLFVSASPPCAHVELLSFRGYWNSKRSGPSERCSRALQSQSPACHRIKHPCFAGAWLPPAPPPPPAPSLSRKGPEICFDLILQVVC